MVNPSVTTVLKTVLPHLADPMLGDLHISLYNKSHLVSLIEKIKFEVFPMGTDWEGLYCAQLYNSS
ncbi:hypothetical protein BS47DRAFT_1307834 [Hydnum rufescens UP504]|uniref:Uncharacterized protein n=1 Tax=Hydnum rufescens UP504 TaxID=1448309 RepID=A0A9P6AG82_9AGAM|nr:hypothetical protein BS47DRAFT_1307834 [Hydnum rufescens UP504]